MMRVPNLPADNKTNANGTGSTFEFHNQNAYTPTIMSINSLGYTVISDDPAVNNYPLNNTQMAGTIQCHQSLTNPFIFPQDVVPLASKVNYLGRMSNVRA